LQKNLTTEASIAGLAKKLSNNKLAYHDLQIKLANTILALHDLQKTYHRICCKICFAACVASLATSNGRRGITKLKNKKIRNFEFVLLNKKEKIIHIAICLEH